MIDTNVARVVCRFEGIEKTVEQARLEIRSLVEAMTPEDRPGDFAQAMMDLGATICRPKAPECGRCPLATDCVARASGEPDRFPKARRKIARPTRYGIAWWIQRDGCVWLVRRPGKGMLGGMAALPGPDWVDVPQAKGNALGSVTHIFTHFRLELAVVAASAPTPGGWWEPIGDLDKVGLPTLYRRAAEAVLANRPKLAA